VVAAPFDAAFMPPASNGGQETPLFEFSAEDDPPEEPDPALLIAYLFG
jgi:hypothetical protein